jgi:hypothetical protein
LTLVRAAVNAGSIRGGPSAANDPLEIPTLTRPPVLWLRQGATRVLRQREHSKPDELWQGDAYSMASEADDEIPVYFRMADRFTVVAELACAAIAKALGLPTPQPFLLNIGVGALHESKFTTYDRATLTVATRDVGGGTFAQLLREDSDYARQLLRDWQHLVPAVAFDEWLANTDRNFGNILFVASSLFLIDHGEAFGGSARKLFPLEDLTETAFTNNLANVLEAKPPAHLQTMLEQAKEWLVFTAGALDVTTLGATTDMRKWHTDSEETELINFVRSRLLVTHKLLCQRLGLPQLKL